MMKTRTIKANKTFYKKRFAKKTKDCFKIKRTRPLFAETKLLADGRNNNNLAKKYFQKSYQLRNCSDI